MGLKLNYDEGFDQGSFANARKYSKLWGQVQTLMGIVKGSKLA